MIPPDFVILSEPVFLLVLGLVFAAGFVIGYGAALDRIGRL